MTKPSFSSILGCLLFLILNGDGIFGMVDDERNKDIYIVYLGQRPHNDVDLITDSHHEMLTKVVGSKEFASKSMVYSYKHGFSGFAARLTESEAQIISDLPDVVDVLPNTLHKLHTTKSWDYLGLSSHSHNTILQKSKMGDGVIVGVIDSGIYPEAPSFIDEGLGPISSHWKGHCVSGQNFNTAESCNRKIIGARWFKDGCEEERGTQPSTTFDLMSPRDVEGHGTHVAAVIAGNFVDDISYIGLGNGTIRGGAPQAKLAIYKVCWTLDSGDMTCPSASILKGIDEAIKDGVDMISVSLGTAIVDPLGLEVDKTRNPFAIGSFHAVSKGIPVITAAGNNGPGPYTVVNTAPWVITVAASTTDRTFSSPITLGNNRTFMGRSECLIEGKDQFLDLVYYSGSTACEKLKLTPDLVAGKVLLCFSRNPDLNILNITIPLNETGGVGLIVSKESNNNLPPSPEKLPFVVEVDMDVGTEMLRYIRYTINAESIPKVKVKSAKTIDGKPLPTKVAYFSSRGPNSVSPDILKPDIAAPGVNILGPAGPSGYMMMSGTSMAAPHVSGIVALLKASHPHWSPAAIKSAIMTTAWNTDRHGSPIYAMQNTATPFDIGAGIVNPNGALNPGLVYDTNTKDYVHYLCSMGYRKAAIARIAQSSSIYCEEENEAEKTSILLDLNLPSITISKLSAKRSTTIHRTVKNVGHKISIYKPKIKPPWGVNISIKPKKLVFNSKTKQLSFNVTFSATSKANSMFNFGSITWTDGLHNVTSPVSVRVAIA